MIYEYGVMLLVRVLLIMSIVGIFRSSGEFYLMSNNLFEMLVFEYVLY